MSVLPTTPAYNKENKFMTDIKKFMNQKIRVKFDGGREVVGNLIGHDAIFNLVLDKTEEYIRDPNDSYVITEKTRSIGLVVARGTSVLSFFRHVCSCCGESTRRCKLDCPIRLPPFIVSHSIASNFPIFLTTLPLFWQIALITPVDGTQEIANPFMSEQK